LTFKDPKLEHAFFLQEMRGSKDSRFVAEVGLVSFSSIMAAFVTCGIVEQTEFGWDKVNGWFIFCVAASGFLVVAILFLWYAIRYVKDERLFLQAMNKFSSLTFCTFLATAGALWMHIFVRISAQYPLLPMHLLVPDTWSLSACYSCVGMLGTYLIGSCIYVGVFRPRLKPTCGYFVLQVLMFAMFNGIIFSWTMSSVWAFFTLLHGLALGSMLAGIFLLEKTRRDFFLQVQRLEQSVLTSADVAREQGRAQAERLIVAFLCHEIRNPMNGILGYAEQLSQLDTGDVSTKSLSDYAGYADTILSCSKHIISILDNVLDISKLEAGKLVMQRHPIDCSMLCADIQESLGSQAAPGVKFTCSAQRGLRLMGDVTRWKQILINLVGNALKFTVRAGGFVRLEISKAESGSIVFSVSDSASIIPEAVRARLFSKYEQAQNLQKGTGLGLVIAQNLVNLLGSTIQVKSPWQKDGSPGSQFFFVLEKFEEVESSVPEDAERLSGDASMFLDPSPKGSIRELDEYSSSMSPPMSPSITILQGRAGVPAHEVAEQATETSTQPENPLVGLCVLLVDDDPMNRTIMKFKFQKSKDSQGLGILCDEAGSAEDALKMFHSKKSQKQEGCEPAKMWDVVVVDEHLSTDPSHMLGSQLIHSLRAADYGGLVISCSGNCTAEDNLRYLGAGADAVWAKPYPAPAVLLADLARWQQGKKKDRE
jgi:signal transduction histidine kinase/CheY-like chemotaxis protein